MWKTPFNSRGQRAPCTAPAVAAEAPRPVFRVAAFGLGQRFLRLIELIFQCEQHNPHRYELADTRTSGEFDIALVNLTIPGGVDTARRLRSLPRAVPVIGVGRRANRLRGADDLLFSSFTHDVLGVLNRSADILVARAQQHAFNRSTLTARTLLADSRLPADVQLRALVIDPSPSSRSHVTVGMRQLGLDVDGVGTLEQASDVLATRAYDLILVDPQQPDGCGLEMLRRYRKATGSTVPVVVLSARSGISDLLRSAMAGCAGYLVKPLSSAALQATVRRVLLRHVYPRQGAAMGAVALGASPKENEHRQPAPGWRVVDSLRSHGVAGFQFVLGKCGLGYAFGRTGRSGGLHRHSARRGGQGATVDSFLLGPTDVAVWRPGSTHSAVEVGMARSSLRSF